MSSANNNLSDNKGREVPDAKGYKFGIVWAEWNTEITMAMKDGAFKTLMKYGVSEEDITIKTVPGSFELTLGAQWMIENADVDAVICIGCVIQGETKHFDFICNAVADGITKLNIEHSMPVIFGVLTTNNMQQAIDRAGGKHGNKGDEAAVTAIKMLAMLDSF